MASAVRGVLAVFRLLTLLLAGAIVIVVAAGVFWRYVLSDALSWSEEVGKYCMVWLTFTGAPIALAQGGHVAIELLPRSLPPRLRHLLLAIVLTLVVVLLAVFVWRGWTFAWNGRTQVVPMVGDLSMFWIFVAIPIGSAAMLLVATEQALRHLGHALAPDRFAAPVHAGLELAPTD
jgi:TRAP-type C4-dicarboxylate transport system permease small subunit